MSDEECKIVDLIVQENTSEGAPLFAYAQPQCHVRVRSLWLDGETIALDSQVVVIGDMICTKLPAKATRASQVAFVVSSYGDGTPEGNKRLISGRVRGEYKPGSTVLRPNMTTLIQCDRVRGRIIGVEFDLLNLCGTCQGTGEVGHRDFLVTCPACNRTLEDKKNKNTSLKVVDVRVGTESQTLGGEALPAALLKRGNIRTDYVNPGLLASFSLLNDSNQPVRLSGFVYVVGDSFERSESGGRVVSDGHAGYGNMGELVSMQPTTESVRLPPA